MRFPPPPEFFGDSDTLIGACHAHENVDTIATAVQEQPTATDTCSEIRKSWPFPEGTIRRLIVTGAANVSYHNHPSRHSLMIRASDHARVTLLSAGKVIPKLELQISTMATFYGSGGVVVNEATMKLGHMCNVLGLHVLKRVYLRNYATGTISISTAPACAVEMGSNRGAISVIQSHGQPVFAL